MSTDPAPPGPAFRRRRIPINSPAGDGVMTGIEMGPEGRPIDLVFCHANGFNALTYRTLLSPVAEAGHRVLAIDMRGHGRCELEADPGDGHGSWANFGSDLIGLLETLEVPPAVVAGHSMGGTSGLVAAGLRPDLLGRLVLLDPVVMREDVARTLGETAGSSPLAIGALRRRNQFDSREAAYDAYLGRGAFRTWPAAMLADYLADGLVPNEAGGFRLACAPAWEAANFSAREHRPWPGFFDSTCPIRILKAEIASTCQVDDRMDELTATGRITVETIPGTSHFLPMEVPDLVRAALLEALA
ncbi:alpha/beta hydrolase [Caulobacter sp. NIBR1757]|uniref:alpha/beta fold hydrolase n=1 Tax=Caulobacter sp. NIBR1757 TaxID=3016000 RepID=UPI0022F08D59|nr:alpha/beta hydrolase [Caulobacter sp. NIBR1757]WGM41071.1 2-(acetamidomethylene)succinate hydrolase [Caulobacter sp. NIBR1757]